MPRFLALRAEWRRNPPVHWLVAAALKYRESDQISPRQPTIAALKAAFPNGRL